MGRLDLGSGAAPAFLRSLCPLPLTFAQIKPGQVVKLMSREQVPADCVLLMSSEPAGRAYVETSGLDGETNLKTKQAKESLWNEQGPLAFPSLLPPIIVALYSPALVFCFAQLCCLQVRTGLTPNCVQANAPSSFPPLPTAGWIHLNAIQIYTTGSVQWAFPPCCLRHRSILTKFCCEARLYATANGSWLWLYTLVSKPRCASTLVKEQQKCRQLTDR